MTEWLSDCQVPFPSIVRCSYHCLLIVTMTVTDEARILSEREDKMKTVHEYVSKLDDDVRRRVFACLGIQKECKKLQDEQTEEMRILENKFEELCAPLFEMRRAIVNGERKPTVDEVARGSKLMEVKDEEEVEEEEAGSGVPNFWLQALKNNELVESSITNRDEECLKHLTDVAAKNFPDPTKGFTLTFTFSENPFFSNAVLTKTYHLVAEDEILLEKAEGCSIEWKNNQNLTVVLKKKKQRQKGGKNVRTVTKEEPCESFFNFFNPPKVPESEEEEEEEEEFEEILEADYELGRTIKDKIVPRAVDWFTGEAIPVLQLAPEEREGLEGKMDSKEECKQQ
eukprot:NODE_713_length_1961_cov_58.631799_g660_i0.p1 GENE.NODE_713_length_1961_cov_58.631799_g660_i0~~NODE_713_length_1961_cov_58.631799_g660_i0.p1  ORF type:complete len:340 (+),score=90.09 NODE_713_length_1961_cov_58.631799_g660_i0:813-1832(+)